MEKKELLRINVFLCPYCYTQADNEAAAKKYRDECFEVLSHAKFNVGDSVDFSSNAPRTDAWRAMYRDGGMKVIAVSVNPARRQELLYLCQYGAGWQTRFIEEWLCAAASLKTE
ncbi:hypothetical protein HY932_02455 [Candidatus Falkowbacteria bacterium]|nr:hypothetical protein [Candidatus Falkowbacteria bacterium]